MENQSAFLLRHLNPYCSRALVAATTLCQARAHAEITIEHWLFALLELGEEEVAAFAHRYAWDLDSLWQNLLVHIDSLPRSVHSRPSLSEELQALIRVAWLAALLQDGKRNIRSVHLLEALLIQPHLLRYRGEWPPFSLNAAQFCHAKPLLHAQPNEPNEQHPQASINRVLFAPSFPAQKTQADPFSPQHLSPALPAALDRFTLDITALARAGQIDPIFGRDSEIRQMINILARRRKNNPILVGEPGVGKTALVEGLALRITEGNVPDSLKNVSLRTLDLSLMQAGSAGKGEFEQRLINVIDAVQSSPTPILLFIDEAHSLMGVGHQAAAGDAASLLKPALARGELRTIAATTWRGYQHYFARDAALERRFQMVQVDEPDDVRASLMLRGLKARYAGHHGVHILDTAITAAITLSRRFLTDRQLPDKAVDLLDTAGARVRMSIDTLPEALIEINTGLAALEMEQRGIEQDLLLLPSVGSLRLQEIEKHRAALCVAQKKIEQQYGEEQRLNYQIVEARQEIADVARLAALQQQLSEVQGNAPLLSLDVDVRTVATVLADWTGLPLSILLKNEQSDLLQLENQLATRVFGQKSALVDMAQRLRAAKTGLTSGNGPLGVFLLVGPSGVGKTETALQLADTLFGGEKSLITLNMSEYQEAHSVSQLKGLPSGCVGYVQGGTLTEAIRKRPYSVVLLDEVEKAHSAIINLLCTLFDSGFMRDGAGREVDFRNTVILMTARLGSDLLMQRLEEQPDTSDDDLHALLHPILRDRFQPALLARCQTLLYRPLDASALRSIVEMKLAPITQRLYKQYGLRCHFAEDLYEMLVAACLLPETGARSIDCLLNKHVFPALSKQLLTRMSEYQHTTLLTLNWDKQQGITLAFKDENEEVR